MTDLTRASHEWSTRPDDECYTSIEAMLAAANVQRDSARKATVETRRLQVAVKDNELVLRGNDLSANFTHFSFGQLASDVGLRAGDLRDKLSPEIAADALNYRFDNFDRDNPDKPSKSVMLFHEKPDGLQLRCTTSEKYTRIWHSDILERLLDLQNTGPWQPAPPAYNGRRGLYMGDRDMFAFMVDNNRRIFERAQKGGLSRGFFVGNSEVGDAIFDLTAFFYAYICGNHIVWEAKGVRQLKVRHIGRASANALTEMRAELISYADNDTHDDQQRITKVQTFELGKNKDEVLAFVFSKLRSELPKTAIAAGYQTAVEHEDWYGNPRTVWGLVNGITHNARDAKNADERTRLDRGASKIMEIAF